MYATSTAVRPAYAIDRIRVIRCLTQGHRFCSESGPFEPAACGRIVTGHGLEPEEWTRHQVRISPPLRKEATGFGWDQETASSNLARPTRFKLPYL